jgi:hypothetical protein
VTMPSSSKSSLTSRPGASALPLRRVQRERRLDHARRARAQPAPMDTTARPARQHHPRGPYPAPTAASDRRPTDPPRTILDTSPPRPLALARRLPRRARQDPRAPRRLTHAHAVHRTQAVVPRHPRAVTLPGNDANPRRHPPPHPPPRPQTTALATQTPDPTEIHELTPLLGGFGFSPDGTRIATASDDNTARVWDSASGHELARLAHEARVYGVAFSPDGTPIATAIKGKYGDQRGFLTNQDPHRVLGVRDGVGGRVDQR